MMVKDLAVIYVIVGGVLFLAAVIAAAQSFLAGSAVKNPT
jgi:hypothetical protein